MGGANGDWGTIAQNMITYFGGAAGGYIVLAATLVVALLAVAHLMSPRAPWMTFGIGACAWCAAFAIRSFIGWA
jgi:hypothetical protein